MTKKWIALPVAAVVAVGLVACGEEPTALAPMGPNDELVHPHQRVLADVNAEVYATFYFDVEGDDGITTYILGSKQDPEGNYIAESALFPGKGKALPGSCEGGKWFNPQGKATTGSMDRPHPHCVDIREGGEGFRVVLEKISAKVNEPSENQMLILGYDRDPDDMDGEADGFEVKFVGNNQKGSGIVLAWGVREGTTDRVGHFEIDLSQFEDSSQGTGQLPNPNLFDCSLSGDFEEDGCLNKEVKATYRHGTDGEGEPEEVWGKLYWFKI